MSDATQNRAKAQLCFEDAFAQLEFIVAQLEEGQIGLAEGLARYEEGVKLLKHCYQLLASAERRIELLKGVDPDGQVTSEPLGDEAISLEEKAQSRSRTRSRAAPAETSPPQDEMDGPGRLF
jgi:exodeoxyribonuclease VII small subunit